MSTPLSQLSQLDLIRGFVAVGRRMSITLAAQDLCLTQSAVSRQVQALEALLDTRLLVRGHRAIAFTEAGERLFRTADVAVQQLQDVCGSLRADSRSRPVTISASIGVTSLWLLPRLSRLQARHPGTDVRVAASNQLSDMRHDGIDLAIRYTSAQRAPVGAVQLFAESVTPVCHPTLAGKPWRSASALKHLMLLEFDEPRYAWLKWAGWLASRGWSGAPSRGVLHLNQYDLTIQAALAGQGVALGRLELIGPLLASGQLVRADSAPPIASRHGYWLLTADGTLRPEVERVAEWIRAEGEATQA